MHSKFIFNHNLLKRLITALFIFHHIIRIRWICRITLLQSRIKPSDSSASIDISLNAIIFHEAINVPVEHKYFPHFIALMQMLIVYFILTACMLYHSDLQTVRRLHSGHKSFRHMLSGAGVVTVVVAVGHTYVPLQF